MVRVSGEGPVLLFYDNSLMKTNEGPMKLPLIPSEGSTSNDLISSHWAPSLKSPTNSYIATLGDLDLKK